MTKQLELPWRSEAPLLHASITMPAGADAPCTVVCRCGYSATSNDLWHAQQLAWDHDQAHWRGEIDGTSGP